MMRFGQQFGGDMVGELLLGLERCAGVAAQSDAGCNTKNVRIDWHHKFVVNDCTNNICGLATHAR